MPSMRYISSGGNQMNINNVTFDRGIMAHTSDFTKILVFTKKYHFDLIRQFPCIHRLVK